MRNMLLAGALLLTVLPLAGCQTAHNMSREVPRWFDPNMPQAARPAPVDDAGLAPGGPVKVALLLPLSGDKASLGKNFLDAAQMAVYDTGRQGGAGIELLPKDSGADSATAGAAAAQAVQDGAALIVGPVSGAVIPAVRNAAPHIPVLALSNDASMAGGNVYVMGFNPAEQVRRIADFAATQNVRNLAVLVPSSVYGELVLGALAQTRLNVAGVHRYQKNRESIDKAVADLAAARDGIDGILIPEGGAALAALADALMKNGITAKTMPIFGTGLWDDRDSSRSAALLGGYFAAPDPAARSRFMSRIRTAQSAAPVRLATLSYDATALAAVLAAQGRGFDEAALTNPAGFAGLDGLFRLNADHVAERGLAVMQVTAGGTQVAEPAPPRF